MKVSIVTISFNQQAFLEQCICSVLEQDYPDIEYIIVDAGSTDNSRIIIEKYKNKISKIILESDDGPADGLNKGFAKAEGEIFGYLNSDDILMPSAISIVVNEFRNNQNVDVLSGHCNVIDSEGHVLRKGYSENFSLALNAYDSNILIQPSSFFRRDMFFKTKGFNVCNKTNWDGELFIDMALNKAKFKVVNRILSGYRVHSSSITGSKKLDKQIRQYKHAMFKKIMNRSPNKFDKILFLIFRFYKHIRYPRALIERIIKGPIYGKQ